VQGRPGAAPAVQAGQRRGVDTVLAGVDLPVSGKGARRDRVDLNQGVGEKGSRST